MFDYRDCVERLHVRGLHIDEKQYLFAAMVATGEDVAVAYGLVYDTENFKREVPSENEAEYLKSVRPRAESVMEREECRQIRDIVEEEIRAEVQSRATNIKEYKFSTKEIVNMLSSLLADRSSEISEASVRDIVSLIRELVNMGGLSNSDGFGAHFIQVHDPFNARCTKCGHEFDCYPTLDCYCPHCHQLYEWSEEDRRYYPNVDTL